MSRMAQHEAFYGPSAIFSSRHLKPGVRTCLTLSLLFTKTPLTLALTGNIIRNTIPSSSEAFGAVGSCDHSGGVSR